MRCKEAMALLVDLMAGRKVKASSSDVRTLMGSGLVAAAIDRGSPSAAGRVAAIRERLLAIAVEKEGLSRNLQVWEEGTKASPSTLYKNSEYRASKEKLTALEEEERRLRTEFINQLQDKVEASTVGSLNGQPVYVTYRGRETVTIIGQRVDRVGNMEMDKFLDELERTKAHFDWRAKRAAAILRSISPKLARTDEIHLRLAAVGLSAWPGDPTTAADMFLRAFNHLPWANLRDASSAIVLSEILVLHSRDRTELDQRLAMAKDLLRAPWEQEDPVDLEGDGTIEGFGGMLDRLKSTITDFYSREVVSEDKVRAVAIIMASDARPEELCVLTRRIAYYHCPSSLSAAAIMASAVVANALNRDVGRYQEGDLLHTFVSLLAAIGQEKQDTKGDPMAAALMATSGMAYQEVLDRFQRAWFVLEKFNGGGMKVPASMVAILPYGIDEAMDNTRLASASINANRLSLGGLENLSLGIKLLVHSSTMAGAPWMKKKREGEVGIDIPMPLIPASMALATVIGAGVLAFHEFALHKVAVREFTFHPVHTHYVYG